MSWKADVFQDFIISSDFVQIKTFSGGQNCIFLILVDSIIEIITEKG